MPDMQHSQNINIQEENDFRKILELVFRNYKLFILSIVIVIGLAFVYNRYSTPIYGVSASILIKEKNSQSSNDVNDFLNSSLFGKNTNFQNELWVIKSAPVLEKTIRNLDLNVNYYNKGKFKLFDAYHNVPFKISYLSDHPQPVFTKFIITFMKNGTYFQLKADSKDVSFYNFAAEKTTHKKDKWSFLRNGKFGELIETPDLAFLVEPVDSTIKFTNNEPLSYGFEFLTPAALYNGVRSKLSFSIVDKNATVISIGLRSESANKGINIVNELMAVYSDQNLERKNHTATITIDYIEKQLNEISDSLNQTEETLQSFRSSNQLLNITDQATGITAQRRELQNQLAELISRKRYYDYVSELMKNENFSNLMLPASMGISDQLLNNLMSELITAQTQRSNLIENNQERNPMVQKLGIQIENLKKLVSENISGAGKSTNIAIDEMTKRIKNIESEISRLPRTQRQLGNIEREYRLNDAIYNYLMEKHAEAKITKASNLPDDIIVEPAKAIGLISPNTRKNYLIAFFLGLALPFGFLIIKDALNNKIDDQDDIEKLCNSPVLGKILHNRYKTSNVVYEVPKSNIAESFRTLRTNLDFYVRGGLKKVIMVTSSLENEGKSFIARNLAMSYAQLGPRTILVDFDLRKPKNYFNEEEASLEGLSSYMINKTALENIIRYSPHEKLHYILAGILPPNPVELIALEKTKMLLTNLKKEYDIIVLDTTPLAQVTDAFLLIEDADIKIIVTRQGYTIKNVFSLIMKDLQNKGVSNICVVLNDNKHFQDQYGYGYGYYRKGGKRKSDKQK